MAIQLGGQHIEEAAYYFELLTGKAGSSELFQRTFTSVQSGATQFAGNCEAVSRNLTEVFASAGEKLEYLKVIVSSTGSVGAVSSPNLGFETIAGDPSSTVLLSNNGYHWATLIDGIVYDAWTIREGGVELQEYLQRLFPSVQHIIQPTPPPVPQ